NPTRHYPLLYRVGGIAVFGPTRDMPSGYCPPGPLLLSPGDRQVASRIVRAGVLRLQRRYSSSKFDRRDAQVRTEYAASTQRGRFAEIVCSPLVRQRTFVVTIHYPHVRSASLSDPIELVSHIRDGWKIWATLH